MACTEVLARGLQCGALIGVAPQRSYRMTQLPVQRLRNVPLVNACVLPLAFEVNNTALVYFCNGDMA